MQREEKQMDATIDAVLNRLVDIKRSIGALIFKLETEHETINWPAFLDNFALISSHQKKITEQFIKFHSRTGSLLQFTGLMKILAHETTPPLRNLTVLPLLLSQDRDETIFHLTEGRIPVFSHDLVPDYLRTKLEPVTEERLHGYEHKANNMTPETTVKQMAQFSKVLTHIFDMVSKAREEWDVEASTRPGIQQTSSLSDTHALLTAIGLGKGLVPDSVSAIPSNVRQAPSGAAAPSPAAGKAPSAIKTNIKSANQIHPYVR